MSMLRPGPLLELPLEQFLPLDPYTLQASARPGKRPLSPGVSKLLSPAKRRILNEEGVLLPEKARSPLSCSSKQSSPGRFSEVLNGPGSPARVLDFGTPRSHPASARREAVATSETTPRRPVTRSISKLAPPPELNLRQSSSRHDEDFAIADMFDSQSSTRNSRSPVPVPRELPPSPDPQSIHYPGFEVYRDPYIVIFPPISAPQPEVLKDEVKENLPCRRKIRKTTSTSDKAEPPQKASSLELTKREREYGTSKAAPPKKIFGMCAAVPSPGSASRRLEIASLHVTSPTSNLKSTEVVKRKRKMKIMEEVDEAISDLDDEDNARHVLH
ncbi:hypothetical protein AX15_002302 [Amanita polypyramis BW_CC]|nr:hypothetical protein AX15_002302 [Amanita polypyramis BW_CC]